MSIAYLNTFTKSSFHSTNHHVKSICTKPNSIFTRRHNKSSNHSIRSKIHMSSTSSSKSDTPLVPSTSETSTLSFRFRLIRSIIFFGMALTYATYVFLRSTFTYVSPVMAKSLSFSLESIGKISSAFPIAYGMSRLFTGVLVDRTLPHIALAIGLLLAGIINVTMGSVSSILALAILWALNGLVQGVGAGASAKMLTSWFSTKQRGFYWALWSTSANVGGFLAPIVCGYLTTTGSSFRSGMILPGSFAIFLAIVSFLFMKSSPKNAGLIAPWENEKENNNQSSEMNQPKLSWKQALIEGVIKNKTIWALAISYFFVYLVRSGMKSWMHFWLLDARSCTAAEAAYRVSGMEIGGIAGTFSAGLISDAFDGRRVAVTICYLMGLLISLSTTWFIPGGKPLWDFIVMSIVGFMINGPQMMIGLIGAEVSDKRVVATATGVLGWISYLGAAASGYPLSIIVRQGGWGAYFIALLISTICSILFLTPMWRLKGETSR